MPRFSHKRATDLLLPSIVGDDVRIHSSSTYPAEVLVGDAARNKTTGCIKSSNESLQSRGGMLLYRDRLVGCIRISINSQIVPTEQSARLMLADLTRDDTTFVFFTCPEEVTLAFSALFLGRPIDDGNIGKTPQAQIEDWRKIIERDRLTGCISVMTKSAETQIFLFASGCYCGRYAVEEQRIDDNPDGISVLLKAADIGGADASVLDAEPDEDFGFDLSFLLRELGD